VRPVRLVMAGVRSYRDQTVLEFGDRSLVAIVGDTGAGKSSILEAITYALYAGSTWSNQPGDLISDAVPVMRVVLDFVVDGVPWRVERATSRTAYPPAVHHLENLVTGEKWNGRSDVTGKVEEIVGLDHRAFLRAVVLPQGRFDDLLNAKPGERNGILKNIFRVDELERVRVAAKELRDRLRPPLAVLDERRRALHPDPAAALAEATAEQARAAVVAEALDAAQRDATALQAEVARAEAAGVAAERAAAGLPDPADVDRLRDATAGVAAEEVRLAGELDAASRARDDAAAELRRAADRLAARDDDGTGGAALARARAALEALPDAVARVADGARRLGTLRSEATAAERLAGERASGLDDLREAEERAVAAADEAERAAAGAEGADAAARAAVAAVVEAASALDQAEQLAAGRGEAAGRAASGREAAEAAERERRDERTAATSRLEDVRREDAAAHAAEGLAAGDPCPVCRRSLPDGFTPPAGGRIDEARRAVTAAEAALAAAQRATAAAATAEAAALARAGEAAAEAERARARLAAAVAAAGSAVGADVAAGDLVDGADRWLAPLAAEAAATRQAAAGARAAAVAARDDRVAAQATVDQAVAGAERARRAAAEEERSVRRELRRLAAALAAVDARWRPAVDLGPDIAGAGPDALASLDVAAELGPHVAGAGPDALASLDVAAVDADALAPFDVAAELGTVARLESELAGLRSAHRAAEEAADGARRLVERLEAERRAAVDEPFARLRQQAAGLLERLAAAADLLGAPDGGPPGLPVEGRPGEWQEWAGQAAGSARSLRQAADRAVAAARDDAEKSRSRLAAVLAGVGVDAAGELPARLAAAMAARLAVDATVADLERQVPLAADLDRRIPAARQFLDDLGVVADELRDGSFVKAYIERRQRALLGVASTILSGMTADRYAFSDDFRIVDRLTNQARTTKTLSGGETFLASLALALGMVELAARAGGRLDALFLDEGFGSLDANSLDAAVDALEARAGAGRLVAVISHVQAVAERIPDVLAVTSRPGAGSRVAWLGDAEAPDDDLSRVLAGLLR
jgi:DNA repair protein SbcC/Rad50